MAKLDPNIPPGLENFTPIDQILMKPFDGNLDLEHPFISFSKGKKYQIMDGMSRVLFYAISQSLKKSIVIFQKILQKKNAKMQKKAKNARSISKLMQKKGRNAKKAENTI